MKKYSFALLLLVLGIILVVFTEAKRPSLHWTWQRSLPVDPASMRIDQIGGTEARAFAVMNGKLYAAIGYWMDSLQDDPHLPGAQVLVKESAKTAWHVDLQLDQRQPNGKRTFFAIASLAAVTFDRDIHLRTLASPVTMLAAGVWRRGLGLDVFTRSDTDTSWHRKEIQQPDESEQGAQVRAFIAYTDKVSGHRMLFAGATNAIFTAEYDDQSPGHLHWNAAPEVWPGAGGPAGARNRVLSFAECNGKLYATVGDGVYERRDGMTSSWVKVLTVPIQSNGAGVSGIRGATTVDNPSGTGQSLLLGLEDNPAKILRFDPQTDSLLTELNVAEFLTKQFGSHTGYAITAYNGMAAYPDPESGKQLYLIGFEAISHQYPRTFGHQYLVADAHFLIRKSTGVYELRKIEDLSISPAPSLVATRTMIVSPFADDPPGTIYAGGFDCNKNSVHNSAWIYRGVLIQ